MKTSTLLLTTAVAVGVSADWCKENWLYCGHSLLEKGNYLEDIHASLQRAGQAVDNTHVLQSLFYCNGKKAIDGIDFITFCTSGCKDRGSLHDDKCSD